jgi:hypothetical protein
VPGASRSVHAQVLDDLSRYRLERRSFVLIIANFVEHVVALNYRIQQTLEIAFDETLGNGCSETS